MSIAIRLASCSFRRMLAQLRYAVRHDPQHVRVLARRFTTAIHWRCRQYMHGQTSALLCYLRGNDNVLLADAQSCERCPAF